MSVSLVFLTYNRAAVTAQSLVFNLANAGDTWDEVVWVDNGSTDGVRDFMFTLNPSVAVLHSENLGVAKGYNHGFLLSKSDWIVTIGVDRIMPDGWLKLFKKYATEIENTGVFVLFSQPLNRVSERLYTKPGEALVKVVNDLSIIEAMPIGAKIIGKWVFKKVGYFREDLGLYGYSDVDWSWRCRKAGVLTYTVPDVLCKHLGDTDSREYILFKGQEANLSWNILKENPKDYYNPYAE